MIFRKLAAGLCSHTQIYRNDTVHEQHVIWRRLRKNLPEPEERPGKMFVRDFFVTELCFVMLRDAITMVAQSRYININQILTFSIVSVRITR